MSYEILDKNKLSPKEYWDMVLKNAHLPRCNRRKTYNYRVTMDFIDRSIRDGYYKTFMEVGCGSSGWLPYFAKKYDLLVSGLDYSEIGCRLAEENLKMQNIQYDEIICKDIFETNCTSGKKYDIVFSYGVIEHFENTEEVIRILKSMVNPNGILITLVPNLNGLGKWIRKIFTRKIYDMHKIFTKQSLLTYCCGDECLNLKTGYAGNFTFAALPLIRSKMWFLRENTFIGKITLKLIYTTDRIITLAYMLFRINIPTKWFSPYIISIVKNIEK
jgi:2-polyprenyl-3-methyl-5-hydroxy-6-metoxy-1,4-benzoquinol methylase